MIGTPDMRIEMGCAIELSPRDTVLLATDGLFDNLRTREIVELLRKGTIRAGDDRPGRGSRASAWPPRAGRRRRSPTT